jgi:hypothetical protein
MPQNMNDQVINTVIRGPGVLHVNSRTDDSRVVVQNITGDETFVSTTNGNHEHVTFATDSAIVLASDNAQHQNLVIVDMTGDQPIVTHVSTHTDPLPI